MMTMDTTIMSSMRVKPLVSHPPTLPILVLGTIECGLLALRHHIVDIFTAPTGGLRTILVATQSPIGFSREWINRHHPQIASYCSASNRRLFSRQSYS